MKTIKQTSKERNKLRNRLTDKKTVRQAKIQAGKQRESTLSNQETSKCTMVDGISYHLASRIETVYKNM